MGIEPAANTQLQLFDERNRERDNRLQQAIDKVNAHFGKNTVRQAVFMQGKQKLYEVGQKSPEYTTNFREIMTLHV